MIERRADWKHAEQSDARFFPTISPSRLLKKSVAKRFVS
jgi:hypothetical protein